MAGQMNREEQEWWMRQANAQHQEESPPLMGRDEELRWLNRAGPEPKKRIEIDFEDPFAPKEPGALDVEGLSPLKISEPKPKIKIDFKDPFAPEKTESEVDWSPIRSAEELRREWEAQHQAETPILPPEAIPVEAAMRRIQIPQATTMPQRVEKEEGWLPVIGKSVMGGFGRIATGITGAAKAEMELKSDLLARLMKLSAPEKAEMEEKREATLAPVEDLSDIVTNYWTPMVGQNNAKRYASAILGSTVQSGATMLTGGAGLPLFGITSGGEKYRQLRKEGEGVLPSFAGALPVGVSEAATEIIPFKFAKAVGLPLVKRMAGIVGSEIPGELINTMVEDAIDKVTIRPEMTWGDFFQDLVDTVIVTTGQSLLMGGASHIATRGTEQEQQRAESIQKLLQEAQARMAVRQGRIPPEDILALREPRAEIKEEAKPVEEELPKPPEEILTREAIPTEERPKAPLAAGSKAERLGWDRDEFNSLPLPEQTKILTKGWGRGDVEVDKDTGYVSLTGEAVPTEEKPAEFGIMPGRRVDWMEPGQSVEFFDDTTGKMRVGVIESTKAMEDGTIIGAIIKSKGKTYTPRVDDITGRMKMAEEEAVPTEPIKEEEITPIPEELTQRPRLPGEQLRYVGEIRELREIVAQGEPGQRITGPTGEWTGRGSSYPTFMRDKGWTKKEVLTAIDKGLRGKMLGVKQQEIWDSAIKEARGIYADRIREQKTARLEEIPTSELDVGDRIKVRDEVLKVTQRDDEKIVIQDGQKYELDPFFDKITGRRIGAPAKEVEGLQAELGAAIGPEEEKPLTLQELFRSGRKEITDAELRQLPDVIEGRRNVESMRLYLEEKGIKVLPASRPELSATAKEQYRLPGIKTGLKMPEKGIEAQPTLEGTPLAEAAREAEVEKVQPTLPIEARKVGEVVEIPEGWKTEVQPNWRRTPGWQSEVDWKNRRIVFETEKDAQNIDIMNHEIAHIRLEEKIGAIEKPSDSLLVEEYVRIRKEPKDTHINFIREHLAMDYGQYLTKPDSVSSSLKNLFEKYFPEAAIVRRGWQTGAERPFAFDPNSTENQGRFRLTNPNTFDAKGMGEHKFITRFRKNGIKEPGLTFIVGKVNGEEQIRALRFDKKLWTEERAGEWWMANAEKFGRKAVEAIKEAPAGPIEEGIDRVLDLAREYAGKGLTVEDLAVGMEGGYRDQHPYFDATQNRLDSKKLVTDLEAHGFKNLRELFDSVARETRAQAALKPVITKPPEGFELPPFVPTEEEAKPKTEQEKKAEEYAWKYGLEEGELSAAGPTAQWIEEPVSIPQEELAEIRGRISHILPEGTSFSFVDQIFIDTKDPSFERSLNHWFKGDLRATLPAYIMVEGVTKRFNTDASGWVSMIEVATKGFGKGEIENTSYHEAWHSIKQGFLIDDVQQEILGKKFASEEDEAVAFAEYAQGEKKLLPLSIKKIFDRIKDFFEGFGNYLRGLGFTSAGDIFGKAYEGMLPGQQRAIELTQKGPGIRSEDLIEAGEVGALKVDPFDFLGKFKERYTLNLTDKDLSKMKVLYSNPWHIGKDHEGFRTLIDIETNREEKREQLIHQFLSNTIKGSPSRVHEFLALPADEARSLFQVMVWCDANNTFFSKPQELKNKARELRVGNLSKAQVSAYYAWKRSMNKAWDTLVDQAEKMTFRSYEGKPWVNELKALAGRKKEGETPLFYTAKEKALYGDAETKIAQLSAEERKEFDRAMARVNKPASRIQELRREIGRIQYYVPRQREQGKYVIRVRDEKGGVIHSERAPNTFKGKQIEERLKREFPGMKITASIEKPIPEFVFQQISDIAIEKFVDRAVGRLQAKEEITLEDAEILRNGLLEALTEQLKGRGFGRHMIARREGKVITGYETEDGKKVLTEYMTGMAGFITKQEAALDFYNALEGVDIKKQPTLFEYGSNYIRDMLRNTTDLDRYSGKARSIAFAYYLAGNLKSAAVQFSQNFVTGIPFLGRETSGPQGKYIKAMKDVALNHLSKEERDALHEAIDKGITTNQYLKEITGQIKGKFGGRYERLIDLLAMPFSGMEIYNRKSAFVAMFRVARQEQRMGFDEAIRKARDYVYDTHYLYGKANLPSWARAGTTGSAIARTAYTFRSFTHNYLLSMSRSLKGPDGKIALDIMGRSLAYLALFGGLTGLPFLDDLLDEMERLFGVPYRKQIKVALKGVGGEMLEKFGMGGLPALLGFNLSGSLRIGIPKPSLRGVEESVYGVYGGLIDKGERTLEAFGRGDILRAIEAVSPTFVENLFKASRMYQRGATTPTGKVMYDEEGQPIQLTGPEAIGQAMGFRPEKMAEAGMERRVFTNVESHYKERRNNLYAKYRLAKTDEEREKILKEIERYNMDVMKFQGAIPRISRESLKRTFTQKPSKQRQRFGQVYSD